MNEIKIGDIVLSLKGRDKQNAFLVVELKDGFAYLVDGKVRKTTKPKKKSVKHIKKISDCGLKSLASEIKNGLCVGNKRVYISIKGQQK